MDWILFLTQLPSHPSSLRVNVWRRMRAAGAVSLQNGVWILPLSPKNEQFLTETRSFVHSENGEAVHFVARMPDRSVEDDIVEKFRAGADREYEEFHERCQGLIDELARESIRGKFTFAELDENEEDLQKLTSWLRKIRARDFFEGGKAAAAASALERCRKELQAFEKAVYKSEGLENEGI